MVDSTSQPMSSVPPMIEAMITMVKAAMVVWLIPSSNCLSADGTRTWKIAEIFQVEPGRKVSVLCEEGHTQEAIYFRYNPDNKVWYRVTDFESAEAKAYPAVIVE